MIFFKKEKIHIHHDTFCGLGHFFCAVYCTQVFHVVISTEHLAIASAGFLVLFASFAV